MSKKIARSAVLLASVAVAALAVPGSSLADQISVQNFFGGRPSLDGSINLRNPVTSDTDMLMRGVSVNERIRPDFDPTPISVGSFDIFPGLEASERFEDNIYSTTSDPKSDMISNFIPSLNLFSNWGRHAVSLTSYGDFGVYADHSKENYKGVTTNLQGRYDFAPQTWLNAGGGYQRITEKRSSPNSPAAALDPVQFNVYKANVEAYRGQGLLQLDVSGDFKKMTYDNVPSMTGIINETIRDRNEYELATRVGYQITPSIVPYIAGSKNWREYTSNSIRDSNGYEAHVGTSFDFGGITTGKVYVGYMSQDYTNIHKSIDGLNFGADVLWNVTGLTSVRFNVERSVQETTDVGQTGYTNSSVSGRVEHELMRELLLNASALYSNNAYSGGASRSDNIYAAGVGARYFVNRYLYTDLTYDYTRRDSDVVGATYADNRAMIGIGTHW